MGWMGAIDGENEESAETFSCKRLVYYEMGVRVRGSRKLF